MGDKMTVRHILFRPVRVIQDADKKFQKGSSIC